MNPDPREGRIDYLELPAPSADSFAATKTFYREAFGWSFQDWGSEYADTHSSGIALGFASSPEHRPAQPLAVLYAADLEGARDRVVRAGGRIVREIFAFPGGRRFEYLDPSGNRLGVWSEK